jgi:hypothetical protein
VEWAVYSLYRLMHLLGASRICILGLRVFIRKFYKVIDLKMSAESVQLLMPLPEALRPWLALNTKFYIILCYYSCYQLALSPGIIDRHLRDKHHVQIEVRK